MKKIVIFLLAMIGLLATFFGFAIFFSWILMLLWNWIMHGVMGLPALTIWQSIGVILISEILFKSHK